MTTIQEINAAIVSKSFTPEELQSLISAVKYAQSRVNASVRCALRIGSKVSWDSKYGTKETGFVTKVNAKSVMVTASSGVKWRVAPTLLKVL